MRKRPTPILPIAAVMLFAGCAGVDPFRPPAPLPEDRRDIARPEEQHVSIVGELVENQVIRQVEQMFDLSRAARALTGRRREAMNVDAFDEVANSSWFTNRHFAAPLSVEEFRRGPDTGSGPDPSSAWKIFRAKSQGVTPGFSVVDGRGDRYLIKFDPPGYPESISGAEVVSTRMFHAAGYNTPENYIVDFDPGLLVLAADVTFTDERGRRRTMIAADVDAMLARVARRPDGRVRALASRYIEGTPVGPFEYHGTRDDDPNDIIPHQHRRELRALRVLAAWLCHFDTKSGNTFDAYVTDGGHGYLRHYLIDFGSTLGFGATGPVPRYRGHENDFDPHAIAFNAATLGLYVRPYERLEYPPFASVGLYEAERFDPEGFKFQSPNAAFENMTERDGYWGAKIVMSITDEHIRAAVESARYSDQAAAEYLVRTLIERRDRVGRRYFSRVNPLDRFGLAPAASGWTLSFDDLAVSSRLEPASSTSYRYTLRRGGGVIARRLPVEGTTRIDLPAASMGVESASTGTQWECEIETSRGDGRWGRAVRVYIEKDAAGGLALVGLRRDS